MARRKWDGRFDEKTQAIMVEWLHRARNEPPPIDGFPYEPPWEALRKAHERGLFGVTQADVSRHLLEIAARCRLKAEAEAAARDNTRS